MRNAFNCVYATKFPPCLMHFCILSPYQAVGNCGAREQNLTLAKSLAQQFPKKYSVDTITEWLNLHI